MPLDTPDPAASRSTALASTADGPHVSDARRPPPASTGRDVPARPGIIAMLESLLFVVEALAGLMLFDVLSWVGFKIVHACVRKCPVLKRRAKLLRTERLCDAVDEACIYYFVRPALCLQRSAVTTWLLRWHGIPAQLVIGYRQPPLQSHAWVEVEGRVVNDRPQYQIFFQVLDRL